MAAKTAIYTFDELKEKSRKALADPRLIEIAKASSSPSQAYKEAEKYVHEQTNDLQKTKELAVATRFLAMLRRLNKNGFEELIASVKQPEVETKRENFFHKEIGLPYHTAVITRTYYDITNFVTKFGVEFSDYDVYEIMDFGIRIIDGISDRCLDPIYREGKEKLREKLIQLLEKKFGLEIKVCGNCENFKVWQTSYCGAPTGSLDAFSKCTRDLWTPKEVSEKKEN